jgi:dihydrofolate synthase / folylpolyglutamate synthase
VTPFDRLDRRAFFGIKLGLDTMRALLDALDHPERGYRSVLIGGTNGKGSVAAFTARALVAAGHRIGLYTSPHLVHVRERYRVNDATPGDADIADALEEVFAAEALLHDTGRLAVSATYFELTTAAALLLFARAGVEVAVLEVGLGGRHDATNVVDARHVAITSIALDHTTHLGHTVEDIAREKAGIIKPDTTVISGVRQPTAQAVLNEVAADQGARVLSVHEASAADVDVRPEGTWAQVRTPRAAYPSVRLALDGRHQADNALVAVRLLEELDTSGVTVPMAAILEGLATASWPGRLQTIDRGSAPRLVLDGAHNAAGAAALADWLDATTCAPVTLVLAVMRDKDVDGVIAPLLPRASAVVTTTVLPPRGMDPDALAARVRALAPATPVVSASTVGEALALADRDGHTVVVAGSLFLVGAMLALVAGRPEPA